jgi:hypothetical protein
MFALHITNSAYHLYFCIITVNVCRDSSVGRATRYGLDGPGVESRWGGGEIFRTCPDRPWGHPNLLYNGYRVFPGVKRPGRGVDNPPTSSAVVKETVELLNNKPSDSQHNSILLYK